MLSLKMIFPVLDLASNTMFKLFSFLHLWLRNNDKDMLQEHQLLLGRGAPIIGR